MTLYQILPLSQGILSGILLILVVWKNWKGTANHLFAAFLFSLTMWGFLIFGMRFESDLYGALWWERAAVVFMTSTPVFFYHFVARYLGINIRLNRLLIVYLYLAAIIVLSPTSLIAQSMTKDQYGNAPILGLFYPVWLIPIYLLVIVAVYQLNKARNASISYEERNRLLYFIIGASVVLFGGIMDLMSTSGISIIPGAIIANIIFALLTSVAILRYNLFDIQVATHKVTPYVVMFTIISIPYVTAYFILGHYRGDERAPLWLWLISVILLIIILGPLWKKVRSWTNWLFYRERYKHLKALDHLQEEAQSVVDPASVSRIFPQLIKQAMEASHLYLLLPSQSSGDFGIAASAGSNNTDSQLSLGKSSPIIKWLESHDDLIHREDLVVIPQLQTLSIREKETLDKMAGELYVPLKSSRRLVGLLIVGPRIDGQPYSWEDEGIINKTTGQLALNIENIQLYNASLEREKQLAALNSLNKAISSSLDIQSTYDLFAGELKKVVPVDWASITLIEDDALRFFALSTTIDSTWGKPGTTIPLKGTATEWIIINKRTLVENDLARRRFFVTGEAHLDHGIRSIAYLPLFSQGDVTGSFIVGCSRPNAYGEREVDFLGQVASQLSLTMENARLYARERGGRARLEILNEQREEFFRAIAHELKTPLTAIKSSGELLSEELVGEGQAPLKRLIDNIRRSADRLEAMLNDLLEMAKARAVPLEMHFQSMDVPAAIRSTVDLCSPSIKQKHQTLTVDIPEECPRIMADPKWFEYIITNLLSNANKFTPEGGKIKLAVWIEDAMMMMAVEDTGAGIPAEEQDLIFEPFYRGKHSGERIKGIGVGLATVKQITRLHGGKVQVSSEFGKGSVFTVSLPLP